MSRWWYMGLAFIENGPNLAGSTFSEDSFEQCEEGAGPLGMLPAFRAVARQREAAAVIGRVHESRDCGLCKELRGQTGTIHVPDTARYADEGYVDPLLKNTLK